jgi:hypothetical protein
LQRILVGLEHAIVNCLPLSKLFLHFCFDDEGQEDMLLDVRPIVFHAEISQFEVLAVYSEGHVQQQFIEEDIVGHVLHFQVG